MLILVYLKYYQFIIINNICYDKLFFFEKFQIFVNVVTWMKVARVTEEITTPLIRTNVLYCSIINQEMNLYSIYIEVTYQNDKF